MAVGIFEECSRISVGGGAQHGAIGWKMVVAHYMGLLVVLHFVQWEDTMLGRN
jgi:hypothetical protein